MSLERWKPNMVSLVSARTLWAEAATGRQTGRQNPGRNGSGGD